MEWFNGTHLVRITADSKRSLGLRIEVAMADGLGRREGEFERFVASQDTYYKDLCKVLAEAVRHAL